MIVLSRKNIVWDVIIAIVLLISMLSGYFLAIFAYCEAKHVGIVSVYFSTQNVSI